MNDKYFSFDGLGTVACEVLYQLCPCCFESLTKCDAAWAHYLELGK